MNLSSKLFNGFAAIFPFSSIGCPAVFAYYPLTILRDEGRYFLFFLSIIIDKIVIFAAVIKHGRQWRY